MHAIGARSFQLSQSPRAELAEHISLPPKRVYTVFSGIAPCDRKMMDYQGNLPLCRRADGDDVKFIRRPGQGQHAGRVLSTRSTRF